MRLLYIDACARDESRTSILGQHFLKELSDDYQIVHLRLNDMNLTPLLHDKLKERDALIEKNDLQNPFFDYAHEFANADRIVIAAPYWDLSFPAILKVYFECISVCGITFDYEGSEIVGLAKAARTMYISTAGGSVANAHYGEQYTAALMAMFGINDFRSLCCDEIDIWGVDVEQKLNSAKKELSMYAKVF